MPTKKTDSIKKVKEKNFLLPYSWIILTIILIWVHQGSLNEGDAIIKDEKKVQAMNTKGRNFFKCPYSHIHLQIVIKQPIRGSFVNSFTWKAIAHFTILSLSPFLALSLGVRVKYFIEIHSFNDWLYYLTFLLL